VPLPAVTLPQTPPLPIDTGNLPVTTPPLTPP